MHEMKDELEDLAFAQLNPDARGSIVRRLSELRHEGSDLVAKVLDELRRVLAEGGVSASVTGREKRPYSIWRTMQRKNVAFEQLFDIMAFRVLVDSTPACSQALGIKTGRASRRE